MWLRYGEGPGGPSAASADCAVVEQSRIIAFAPFADLPVAELDELASAMSEVEVDAGAPIVTHGDFGYVLYGIEEGEVEVRVDGAEEARTLGPGELFGEIALLVTGRRTATVVARTPMRLLSLFDSDFQRVRARVPELERSLRRLGGERLAQ
jgi:CRP-like cAMP-binding protein